MTLVDTSATDAIWPATATRTPLCRLVQRQGRREFGSEFIVRSDEARVDERIRKEGEVFYGIAYADPPASRTRISGSRSKQLGRGAVR